MFNNKQDSLFPKKKTSAMSSTTLNTNKNSFLAVAEKESAKTSSGNGALKYSTTGNDFVDQFGQLGVMKKPRTYSEISNDVSTLWAKNPKLTIAFILFIRMITRVVSLFDGTKTQSVQRGSGLRHEGIVRMVWLNINHRSAFWNNIHLFVSCGSWKDIIQMLSYDLQYNGWKGRQLDWDNFGKLVLAGLENENSLNLIKKYLPQIKTNSKCNTIEAQADNMIAKWICSLLFGSKDSSTTSAGEYKRYRRLKSSGTAHQWQQLISQGKHELVDFNTVHGRALALMVSGKYLANNKLEARYEEWIANKPIAKFTGFVHELFKPVGSGWGTGGNLKKYQIDTINSQFKGVVETAKKGVNQSTGLIVVRDTSSSMTSEAKGTGMSSYTVAKAMALFFSEMLPKGPFANSWIEFANSATVRQWKGSSPYEKFTNDRSEAYDGTNFQSVIDLLCNTKSKGVDESAFPNGILCISDGVFNPSQLNKTNVDTAFSKLEKAGFSKDFVTNFRIVLWDIPNGYYHGETTKFETHGDVKNVFYFSGYDGAIVSFLTGMEGQTEKAPSTAEELFEAAMNQEIMQLIQL